MTTQAPALVRQHSHGADGEPAAPPKTRSQALRSYHVDDFPKLTGREEEWRFTPLAQLRGLHDGSYKPAGAAPGYSTGELPDGVQVSRIASDDPRVGSALVPFDRVSALAYEQSTDALLVSVARGAVPAEPVIVSVTGNGADGAAFGHTVIELGETAEATVVLDQRGPVVLADNVEVLVGNAARLTLVTIADWAPGSVQLQHLKVRVGRDATVRTIAVNVGGELVRQYTSVDYAGRGGDLEAYGLYFADPGQHLEHRLLVDHEAPDCRSRVVYKGALQGESARTIWVGDVLIRAAATGTDTYELNRNLVLTDGARADSVPNLEIETGEVVGAGHASATGRFDDEQLFYLMSRGIPQAEARKLVVRGFFAELLARVPVPELRDRLGATIDARLAEAGS